MNLFFLLSILSFLLPCFVGKCIENVVNTNLTKSATIYNGSYSQLKVGACNGILKGIFGNEKKSGQRRFKRSGRGWSIGKGLNKITGGRSIRNRMDSLFNRLEQRNEPFLGNSYNPMRVDRQLFPRPEIPNAPPIPNSLRAKMAPRQPIGLPSSPNTFSLELEKKARQYERRARKRQPTAITQGILHSPSNIGGMLVNPEYYQNSQFYQRQQLQTGLNTGGLLDRLSARERQKYGRKYLGREVPEPTLQPGQIVPQPIRGKSFRRLQIRASPEDLFGLERINEGRRKRRSVNKFMENVNVKKENREFG